MKKIAAGIAVLLVGALFAPGRGVKNTSMSTLTPTIFDGAKEEM